MSEIVVLTKRELEIMELFWEQDRPLARGDLVELSKDRNWKTNSIHIIVNKLLEKDVLQVGDFVKTGKNYGRTYFPKMSQEDYFAIQLKKSPLYEKSKSKTLKSVVAALVRDDEISDKTIDELHAILEESRGRDK